VRKRDISDVNGNSGIDAGLCRVWEYLACATRTRTEQMFIRPASIIDTRSEGLNRQKPKPALRQSFRGGKYAFSSTGPLGHLDPSGPVLENA